MNVGIKQFNVDMEIRTRGVELEVRQPNNAHIGDLIVTKTQLIWCHGRTPRRNGRGKTWEQFIAWMEG